MVTINLQRLQKILPFRDSLKAIDRIISHQSYDHWKAPKDILHYWNSKKQS